MIDIEKQVIETALWQGIPIDTFRKYVMKNILYQLKIMSKDYFEEIYEE